MFNTNTYVNGSRKSFTPFYSLYHPFILPVEYLPELTVWILKSESGIGTDILSNDLCLDYHT